MRNAIRRRPLASIGSYNVVDLRSAGVGIYAVMAYSIKLAQEIGIRKAMGAARANVLLMVIRQGLMPATLGHRRLGNRIGPQSDTRGDFLRDHCHRSDDLLQCLYVHVEQLPL